MNPYERHIIHTAIADIEGVRSESKGEGPTRHIVIYSTDPNASNLPDRDNARNTRGPRRDGSRGPRRDGRGPRRDGGPRSPQRRPHRDGRGPRRDGGRPYGGPVPTCRAVSLRIVPATPMLSLWPPRPRSASTTATISPSARSSFNLLFFQEK